MFKLNTAYNDFIVQCQTLMYGDPRRREIMGIEHTGGMSKNMNVEMNVEINVEICG